MLPDIAQIPAAAVVGYLLGTLPFAWLTGRCVAGVDIRAHGSKNAGATNCARVAGQGRTAVTGVVFVFVFTLDAVKGWFAVFATQQWLAPGNAWAAVTAGLLVVLGHSFSFWLKFKGGKGAATSTGVFLTLAPIPTGLAMAVAAATILVTRYVSLGSILAAITLPVVQIARAGDDALTSQLPLTLLCLTTGAFVIWAHRGNIQRLRRGEEHRVGGPKRNKIEDEPHED